MNTDWNDMHLVDEDKPLVDVETCEICGAEIDPLDGGLCDECKDEQEEAEDVE
jgi:RecJ-like exonuclease